jgi:hypothetical protein
MAIKQGMSRRTLLDQVKRLAQTPQGERLVRRIGGRWYVDPTLMQVESLTRRVEAVEDTVQEMQVGMSSWMKWSRSIEARLK